MSALLALIDSMDSLPVYNGPLPKECTWGKVQTCTVWAADEKSPVLLEMSTPSHGGFWVRPDYFEDLPQWVKDCSFSGDNWFEEDCSWMALYLYLNLNRIDPRHDGDIEDMFARMYPEAYREYSHQTTKV